MKSQVEQKAEEMYPDDKWEFEYITERERTAFIKGYEADKWIAVEDGLPEIFEGRYSNRVLCITTSGLTRVGFILKGEWMMDSPAESFERYGYTVTHYQLITPPKK